MVILLICNLLPATRMPSAGIIGFGMIQHHTLEIEQKERELLAIIDYDGGRPGLVG
jgi:hypothetical protein